MLSAIVAGLEAHLTKPTRSSLLLQTIVHTLQDRATPKAPTPVAQTSALKVEAQTIEQKDAIKPIVCRNDAAVDILVCEDNEVNQIVFTQMLKSYCQIWCLRLLGHAAIWPVLVVSIPSLNLTPVITLAR